MQIGRVYEDALYWDPPKKDGYGGHVWGYPKSIKVRWDYKSEVIYSEGGATLTSNSIIWCYHGVEVGGYFWKGTIKEVSNFKEPAPDLDFTKNEIDLREKGYMDLDVLSLATPIVKIDDIKPISLHKGGYLKKVYAI